MNRSQTRSFQKNLIATAIGLSILGTLAATNLAHAQTSTTLPGVTVSSPTTLPPSQIYGVTVWTSGGSATAGMGGFQTSGPGDTAGSGAAGMTNELSSVKTLISFKADAACGPQCGDQVVLFQANNLQEAGGTSFAKIVGGQQGSALAQSGAAYNGFLTAGGKFSPLTTGPVPAPTAAPSGN